MNYTIKAHPTLYKGIQFRSRLEATWAAFFDLAGWKWEYEPEDLELEVDGKMVNWDPDFYVTFRCGHSECYGDHSLYVEVKPYRSIREFDDHVVSKLSCFDGGAVFGIDPSVTQWEMCHGAGGGTFDVEFWVPDCDALWVRAKNITQYHPPKRGGAK
jgi:hypothetical protein